MNKYGFIVLNQSKFDHGIRIVVAALLIIIAYPFEDLIVIDFVFLFMPGVLIFNTLSGNCYIYQALGINTCPVPKMNNYFFWIALLKINSI